VWHPEKNTWEIILNNYETFAITSENYKPVDVKIFRMMDDCSIILATTVGSQKSA